MRVIWVLSAFPAIRAVQALPESQQLGGRDSPDPREPKDQWEGTFIGFMVNTYHTERFFLVTFSIKLIRFFAIFQYVFFNFFKIFSEPERKEPAASATTFTVVRVLLDRTDPEDWTEYPDLLGNGERKVGRERKRERENEREREREREREKEREREREREGFIFSGEPGEKGSDARFCPCPLEISLLHQVRERVC